MKAHLRMAQAKDLPFLREMLFEAAFWRLGDPRPSLDVGLERQDLRKLLAGWGRPGDAGLVAESTEGSPLGAAWFRFWTDDDHSYGFVSPTVPEVAIAVKAAHRRRGIGSLLLSELAAHAGGQGISRLSLSVELENPARHLYAQHGFRRHVDVGGAWTMVLDLESTVEAGAGDSPP